jgi:hypothetical protein
VRTEITIEVTVLHESRGQVTRLLNDLERALDQVLVEVDVSQAPGESWRVRTEERGW